MTERSVVTLCGATRRQGDKSPCKRPAGWGTSHVGFGTCKLHGGSTPDSTKHAAKLRAAWQQRMVDQIDPSLKVLIQLRDGEDVAPRDRIKAASWLVEQARTILEGTGGELKLTIRWPTGG